MAVARIGLLLRLQPTSLEEEFWAAPGTRRQLCILDAIASAMVSGAAADSWPWPAWQDAAAKYSQQLTALLVGGGCVYTVVAVSHT